MNDETTKVEVQAEAIRKTGVVRGVLGFVPSLLVFAALCGVAWWGHHTGWKMKTFGELTAAKQMSPKEDWCVEHNVPDSRCVKCHPELVGANMKDWCPEHGVPESKCTLCHPEILKTGVAGDWCPEHATPETSCTLCHPEIAVKGDLLNAPKPPAILRAYAASVSSTQPSSSHPLGGLTTKMKDPKTCQTHAMKVQFASEAAVKKAGVELGQVAEAAVESFISANGEIQYDRNRVAQVSSSVTGKVWRVEKEIGQKVVAGEVIALIDAAEVGKAKAEYLTAAADSELKAKSLERVAASAKAGFRTGAELQEAEAAMSVAKIRVFNSRQALVNLGLSSGELSGKADETAVHFMGLPPALVNSLNSDKTTANLLPLIAPFEGVVIERNVVAGEVVEVSKPLFVIADISRMWITADLPQAEARRVSVGQTLRFQSDVDIKQTAEGKVSWMSTAVDDQTRTVKIRADIANPDGKLLAMTFGKAQIQVRQTPRAIVVPTAAIQYEGCCNVVFVRLSYDIFQTRKVKVGASANGWTEVAIGVLPGEVVVTDGSQVLKAELLKGSLGAGCCVVEEKK